MSHIDASEAWNCRAASLTDSEQSSVRHARAGEHFPNRVIAAFLLQAKFLSHFFQLLLHYCVASADSIELGNASSGRFDLSMSEFMATGLWEEAVMVIRTRKFAVRKLHPLTEFHHRGQVPKSTKVQQVFSS